MRIALITDIHEDYQTLLEAARIIDKQKCDFIVCLGDIVGFSVPYYEYYDRRNASDCIKWIKSNCKYVTAGNHDLFAVRKTPVSNVRGFDYPENWYLMSYQDRMNLSGNRLWLYEESELSAMLSDNDKDYLWNLPETIKVRIEGKNCLFSHFIYPDITGSAKQFIAKGQDLAEHLEYMKKNKCDISFSGHIHIEGIAKVNEDNIIRKGFGVKVKVRELDWISIAPLASSRNKNGLAIWDTTHERIEIISLKRKFNVL